MSKPFDFEKIAINIKCLSIFDKKKRKLVRSAHYKALKSKRAALAAREHTWGISYSAFDGEEILEASIRSIRREADYINVVYQTESWYGDPAGENLMPCLYDLRDKGLIDELIEYTVDPEKSPSDNESAKRNLGLRHARERGCDFFTTMDCDECWIADEVAAAKAHICEHDITHSYCPQVMYAERPTIRYLNHTMGFAPFFSKIDDNSVLGKANPNVPCSIDPTKRLNHFDGAKYMVHHLVWLHHMYGVRKDISKKVKNSSYLDGLHRNRSYSPPGSDLPDNRIAVPDLFGLTELLNRRNDS